jgi:hypothetical protein
MEMTPNLADEVGAILEARFVSLRLLRLLFTHLDE